jgi:conjugative relaxase-like TrwC/TraI family protein
MLSIAKVFNPEYYEKWTDDDYYQNQKEEPGVWRGYVAKILDLPEYVEKETYKNLVAGKTPNGSSSLVQDNGKYHRAGWDCCFSAPKSVSIAMVIDKRQEIIAAHEQAVDSALRFLEKKAGYTRRGKDGQVNEKLPGLLFSKHRHYDSRAQQPQLHDHCIVYNLAIRSDGSWGTIDSRHLFKWKMAAGAIYRAALSQNLKNIGYTIGRDGDFFKLDAISDTIVEKYSKREKEISALKEKFRITNMSSKAGQKLVVQSRTSKRDCSTEDLFLTWENELRDEELIDTAHQSIQGLIDQDIALRKLTERNSYFKEQDLYQHLAIQGQFSFLNADHISEIAQFTLRSSKVIELGQDPKGNKLYTTKAVIELENELIANLSTFESLKEAHTTIDDDKVKSGIESTENHLGFKLDEEQLQIISSIIDNNSLCVIQGTAGTGKSTSMSAIRAIYELSGKNVIGSATSKKAADSLADNTGIKSHTIDMLITKNQGGENPLLGQNLLIVDEASLLSVRQMNEIVKMAIASKTKLAFAGDIFQLKAINHPGAFSYLLKNKIGSKNNISKIRRQK